MLQSLHSAARAAQPDWVQEWRDLVFARSAAQHVVASNVQVHGFVAVLMSSVAQPDVTTPSEGRRDC